MGAALVGAWGGQWRRGAKRPRRKVLRTKSESFSHSGGQAWQEGAHGRPLGTSEKGSPRRDPGPCAATSGRWASPHGRRLSLQAWGWWQDGSAGPTPVDWEGRVVGWGQSARGQVPWPTGHLPGPPMNRGASALSTDLPPKGQSSKGTGQQIQRRWPGV